ncbi:protein affecting phage T7 exclusion by the F plasmid [Halobacteroides halobius DSM 5150]|uniref:Protein affecting phage T7 exclusion by the F plasmid n=1 Tax=Halobacteroides halobius (strain ATCC 35273 / DSM 5150 / MD-1) TaxID=748449 RepID=L0K785_HALHC|nr:FxsA family protein [Halobacteroides halobius]AGB40395.1 protein affecting phage T7 exclusion by the F plasmid [Halobacteroides halobius DSM 5150]
MLRLFLIFSVVPLIELALLIRIGGYFGLPATIILVAGTGIVGVSLAKQQGLAVINEVRQNLSSGKLPKDSLLDGGLILVGGVLLLTPGLITDIMGFSLIIPVTRKVIRQVVKNQIKDKVVMKSYTHRTKRDDINQSQKNKTEEDDIIDIEDYEEIDED